MNLLKWLQAPVIITPNICVIITVTTAKAKVVFKSAVAPRKTARTICDPLLLQKSR